MWLECIILRVASARFSRSTRFCRMVAGYFRVAFPFLFGGTFIEALTCCARKYLAGAFPSFSEGLSLRHVKIDSHEVISGNFPSFSEGLSLRQHVAALRHTGLHFPFLFGGTFIEATPPPATLTGGSAFPSFSEGLSLRPLILAYMRSVNPFSLPFRRDFH